MPHPEDLSTGIREFGEQMLCRIRRSAGMEKDLIDASDVGEVLSINPIKAIAARVAVL